MEIFLKQLSLEATFFPGKTTAIKNDRDIGVSLASICIAAFSDISFKFIIFDKRRLLKKILINFSIDKCRFVMHFYVGHDPTR